MKRTTQILTAAVLCAMVVLAVGVIRPRWKHAPAAGSDRLLLLLPDGTSFSDPRVTVWLDAANEEGLHVVPMHDSTYLSPLWGRPRCAGLILPDTVHIRAGGVLVDAIRDYVAKGGNLMLVYDAATESLEGFYAKDQSRLSDLAGIKYALYSSLGGGMVKLGDVSGTIAAMDELGVPPGKYYPLGPPGDPSGLGSETVELRRYEYGDLEYPSFVTAGAYAGHAFLHSGAGMVAGYHRYGRGSVLFVNLPLGFLESYTDGLPLHAFLDFFATKMLSLPYLMSIPDGIGGLVLNWHVDYEGAIKPLEEMNTWTIVKQGPYSIDFTAGPDDNAPGDGQGLDVLHNPTAQGLIHYYQGLGYQIGSHGGWLHNYFGEHVNNTNSAEMEQYLELNNRALETVTAMPVREYSAPVGNHPEWVTQWLEKHGVVAYYFTGDTGMGPTIGYRKGQRAGSEIWAFPILHLDRAATFEEMPWDGYSDPVVSQWLDEATDFVLNHRQVRLIYFHPPGIVRYHAIIDQWMKKTAQLKAQGLFRWYTMVQIADFLNVRTSVQWKIHESGHSALLEASDQATLNHQTWRFPKDAFGEPRVAEGTARVASDGGSWFVIAGPGKQLKVEARRLEK